ncbi:PTS ascorbate transporter subunit IIC [Biomaibacter acetigenes]|uniref:Ascorbate-specific PTS system EIIC component n=1 Tax=Biomaibacter acetigenes TaxID=2316383 RepID=A0A3G2R3M7_9FIRM|nr:PTS ascorbate transporter subunit IIC [Biomaibacter acetigenes]AYO29979.1 PTS ascorbate transporter subunit IIC [Biomaibacter acetigenes]
MDVFKFLATQILGQPPILVGLVACLGLIVQRKPIHAIISGTMKTVVGFLILVIGAVTIVNVLSPIGPLLENAFGFKGVVPNDEAIGAVALMQYGSEGALVMVVGFLVNILVARFTKYKYIYLTGHHLLYTALLITVLLKVHLNLSGFPLIIVGGIILGIYCPLTIALVQPYMKKVTGGAPIAYAHSTNLGAFLGGFLGQYVGNPEDSTENIKLPEWLSFFRDTTLSTGFTMILIFVAIMLIVGPIAAAKQVAGGQNWLIWAIMQGLQFGAGVTVLLSGVRMLIAEIVPAFKGFSEKIVPDALPGLDCPVVMPYAPTAWILGFLISFPIGVILTFVMAGMNFKYLLIAGVVPHFFASGPAAVFGNATGGKKGAILAAVVSAVLISFGNAMLIPLTGPLANSGTTWGEMEYGIWGTLFGYVVKFIGRMF